MLGRREGLLETEQARALVGALLLVEGLHELRNIRRLLTPKE
jgi:hypothetical protein